MNNSFLRFDGIRKTYGDVTAVDNVTLDIEEGEFVTFLGPSGSGKSTTLYTLAGFQEPTSGDITLNGQSLLNTPPHKRNLGMVFQRYTLFPHLSVAKNIAFPLAVRRMSKTQIAEKVQKALQLVRLEGFEERMPAQMSGGQQQRVALARALAYDPPVLLMDEPLSALDMKLREEIQHEIRRIHRETSVTILYVTHDQDEALRLSDRIAVFSQGVIDQVGTGTELYSHPATQFVAEFIGDSDLLQGKIVATNGNNADIRLGEDTFVANMPVQGKAEIGRDATLLLRPERIRLTKAKESERTGFHATIRDITFLGNNTSIYTVTDWNEGVSVRLPFGHEALNDLNRGDKVWLSWNPEVAHAFCA